MRRPGLIVLVLLGVAAAPGARAGSRAERRITIPDATAREKALFADVRDDRLDAHDPVTAAIAASNAKKADREKAAARWKAFIEELVREAAEPVGPDKPKAEGQDASGNRHRSAQEKAELALARMHGKLLRADYDFFQNDMTALLLEGSYNCVTSALVYQAAGAALGLDVRGVIVPSHVYVRVVADGVSWDVETTSPHGFLLAKDDAAYAKFLEKMQLDTEKKSGRKILTGEAFSRRETDAIGMIAVLYANRGAFAVEQSRQKEAIGLFARSALLAQDERYGRDSRDLLLAQAAEKQILEKDYDEARRLLKFAIADPGGDPVIRKRLSENIGYTWALEAQAHLDAKRYESAFSCLAAARQYTDDPAMAHNQRATLNVWGLEELDAGRFESAAAVFYRARKAFPKDEDFEQNLVFTYYRWADALLAKGDYRGAVERGRKIMELTPGHQKAAEVFANATSRYAETFGNRGEWATAAGLLEEAWKAAPGLPYLKEELVVAHTNAGVAFAKAGDTAAAERAWKRVLELDPGASAARINLERISSR